MTGIGLSGLASGVDTGGIVDKLMAIERQGLSRIALSKQRVQARQTGLKDVQAKLAALKSAATELRAASTWANTQTLTSSDSTRVGVERMTDSAPGTFSLAVSQLARGTQKTYSYTSQSGPSTLTIAGVPVSLASRATVDQAVASINGTANIGVIATNVSGQIVLSSKATGAASGFTVSGTVVVEDTAKAVAGRDANYTVDGQARTSATNVVEDAIPGTRLTLKALTASPVTVTLGTAGMDQTALKAKIKTFVEAYNAVVATTREKVLEKTDPKSTTAIGQTRGQLFGDPGLTSMLAGLRTAMTDLVTGNPTTTDALADLGISTGKSTGGTASGTSLEGKLVIDDAKLTAAIAADPSAVKRLLGGESGVAGFAQRVEGLVDRQVGVSSLLDGRIKSADVEIGRIDKRYADTEQRLGQREARLRAQFAAMESALQASQTQQSWLTGQLNALNR